ncbi:S26 family signal peptidase [Nonomuraea phyllanthi]|uniref:S26 family signal peptidase n=2 Tax=Nonomuraea phyllanthi TaxID=2219224 RepID=A0A5C4VZN8_9ACTN|nr:S26 family signal peptidase [Nonomuraea phyllanthi]KAB8190982.1 S26 family signal peptidase [Nonomuraea phyllanthi]QFY14820.1 S26 family signal peptidase [Nonomuraea phyllanthi]
MSGGAVIVVALALVVLAGAGLAGLRRALTVVDVEGRSMEPALHAGDRVLVRRRPLERVRTGDIVVVEQHGLGRPGARLRAGSPRGRWVIKRVAGLPGDPVPEAVAGAVGAAPGSRVPRGRFVALGDNPPLSFDSRACGYYAGDRVLGVVLRTVTTAGQRRR